MDIKNKNQKAGDSSLQVQDSTINFIQGIDEKRAREICNETFQTAKQNFTKDAYILASQRVDMFENKLMERISKIEGAIQKFADPAFQLLLVDAHKAAASTEREVDYDLLSELLVHRVESGKDRIKQTGIKHAVEIVNQISDDALMALSICYVVIYLSPDSGMLRDGLKIIDNLLGKLLYYKLPVGNEWIEHLELLGAVRISSMQTFNKFEEIYFSKFSGYFCTGIRMNSENYDEACKLLDKVGLPKDIILVNHEIRNGFVRLPISQLENAENLGLYTNISLFGNKITKKVSLSVEQKNVLREIVNLYDSIHEQSDKERDIYKNELMKYDNIKKIAAWWNNISIHFSFTKVGKILAHVNAKRIDNNIPEIDV